MDFVFLDFPQLSSFFGNLKTLFGLKESLDSSMSIRREYLLEIDYETDLTFNKNRLIGEGSVPSVGYAVVGSTYLA